MDKKLIKKMIEEMEAKVQGNNDMIARTELLAQFLHRKALSSPQAGDAYADMNKKVKSMKNAKTGDEEFLEFLKEQLS